MYAYLGQWNSMTGRPILDREWISEDEARAAYDDQTHGFDIVPRAVRDEAEAHGSSPTPWALSSSALGPLAFRVTFYLPTGSIFRIVDWKDEGERMFLWSVVDYLYPDQDTQYRRAQCLWIVRGLFNTDGTGTLSIKDKVASTLDRLSMDEVDLSGNWRDRPSFGDWAALVHTDAPMVTPPR
jgi:hypothetical protein